MAKEIRITCKSSGMMPIKDLEAFQGDLKSIDDESMEKLKASIVVLQ